ncbi:hypothetical protein DFH11DRAFT_591790 [Phellopilus nigrolimitatus]|nr:hypothetical protein DFH11DRAFT_591790 [Phellopilus nigrolimitatus]
MVRFVATHRHPALAPVAARHPHEPHHALRGHQSRQGRRAAAALAPRRRRSHPRKAPPAQEPARREDAGGRQPALRPQQAQGWCRHPDAQAEPLHADQPRRLLLLLLPVHLRPRALDVQPRLRRILAGLLRAHHAHRRARARPRPRPLAHVLPRQPERHVQRECRGRRAPAPGLAEPRLARLPPHALGVHDAAPRDDTRARRARRLVRVVHPQRQQQHPPPRDDARARAPALRECRARM